MTFGSFTPSDGVKGSSGATRSLVLIVIISVVVSLAAGILIGHYAISKSVDATDTIPEETDPLWPLIAHTWNVYSDMHVARSAWNEIAVENKDRMETILVALAKAENDDDVFGVGSGDHPDESGETTLDAMIMDGETHGVGAVGCLRRVKNAIGVAKAVMDYSTHTLLVGEPASKFAVDMGFGETNLTIQAEIDTYNAWKANKCQPNFRKNVVPDDDCGPYIPEGSGSSGADPIISKENHDTIGMIVIDKEGKMAVGTTTNGLRHKIHGRVGDSPIPGAGSYVDKEVGACTATGNGDVMLRFLPCFHAVELMRQGKTAEEAALLPMRRIDQYYDNYRGAILVVKKDGSYGGGCSGYTSFTFVVQTKGMTEPEAVTWKC